LLLLGALIARFSGMANAEKNSKTKFDDRLIGLEREARESGIVDPKKDELANSHNIPGEGDPSIRRIRPDQGSFVTPPLSEQEDRFQGDEDNANQTTTPEAGTETDEHLVLHTSGGEIPDIPPSSEVFNEAQPGEQPTAKGNTQLPNDRKRKKAA
jgi:hypothetical protein